MMSLTTMGVFTPVGCTVFTRIRCSARVFAYERMSPTTPCFDAV